MYYGTDVYINSVVRNSFIAGGLKVFKDKEKAEQRASEIKKRALEGIDYDYEIVEVKDFEVVEE